MMCKCCGMTYHSTTDATMMCSRCKADQLVALALVEKEAIDSINMEMATEVRRLTAENEDLTKHNCLLREENMNTELNNIHKSYYSELDQLQEECKHKNWDGYGAVPITSNVINKAKQFMLALPITALPPEFAPEPDGSVSIDWIVNINNILSISISTGTRLSYAWINGTDKGHGTISFDGQNIPSRLWYEICEIKNKFH